MLGLKSKGKKKKANDEPDKPRLYDAAQVFHRAPVRRKFTGMTCEPGAPPITAKGEYNMWRDPKIIAAPSPNKEMVSLFHRWEDGLIREEKMLEYCKQWRAKQVQEPGIHIHHAPIFVATESLIGKTLWMKTVAWLHGKGNYRLLPHSQIGTRFNASREFKTLLILEEFDTLSKNELKDINFIIDEDSIPIERKGRDAVWRENHTNIGLSSNDLDAVPQREDARRIPVVACKPSGLTEEELDKLSKWLESREGVAHIRWECLREDTSKFKVRGYQPPVSKAQQEMSDYTQKEHYRWAKKLGESRELALRIDQPLNSDPGLKNLVRCAIARVEDLTAIFNAQVEVKFRVSTGEMGCALRAMKHKQVEGGKKLYLREGVRDRFWITEPERVRREPLARLIMEYNRNRFGE
jgi:hypothetical protein